MAAVQATNPTICPEVQLALQVITAPGEEQGRTLVVDGSPTIGVCLDPDSAQIKALVGFILRQP